jgi:hypothetical protein
VTSNMQEAISHAYQAGIEIGRAAAKQEMEQISRLIAVYAEHLELNAPVNGPAKRLDRAAKAAPAPKAHIVARGVKKAPVTRTKGVKDAIVTLLQSGHLTTSRILTETGFKANSVNGTLMTMKKNGLVQQDENKAWVLIGTAAFTRSNGPVEGASAND